MPLGLPPCTADVATDDAAIAAAVDIVTPLSDVTAAADLGTVAATFNVTLCCHCCCRC